MRPDARGPIAWMARHGVAGNLLMLVAVVGGLLGLSRSKQEIFPEFDLDSVVIQVPYPGASPEEVEQGIVLAVEEAVRGLDGVKRVTSTAAEGSATVTAEVLLGADRNRVLADVKAAVDRVTTFPEDAEEPVVSLAQMRREVISVVLSGDVPLRTLHDLAERARARLLDDPDITQVELVGVPPLEVSIEVPREALAAHGLTLDDVARKVRAASLELPGGEVETRGSSLLLRLSDRRRTGAEFADIALATDPNGGVLRLGDIARITDGYADTGQASYYDGHRAVRLTAYRVGEETPDEVAAAARRLVEDLRRELPPTVRASIWSDGSRILADRIDLLRRNALSGMVLVLVTLAAFLDLRLAFWVGMGIPVSFLGAFFLLPGLGVSINMISLFALIITLGMVVDDAIVVGENAFDKMARGTPRLRAAIEGAREMAAPVTFAILTTLAAFAPLLFVPGTMGKIFRIIPIVVGTVLLVSLAEAFFVLPGHLGHGRQPPKRGLAARVDRNQRRLAAWLDATTRRLYEPLLDRALRHRPTTVAIGLALLLSSCGAVAGGAVPFDFFPKLEGDQVVAVARLPYGTPAAVTEELRRELEAAARRAVAAHGGPGITQGMFTRVGEAAGGRHSRKEVGKHLLTVELGLVPSDEREVSSQALADAWRAEMPPFPGLQSLVFNASSGPGAGTAVDVQLSHPDREELIRASEEVEAALRSYPSLADVENAWSAGKPQVDYHLDDRGRALGLTADDLARQVRAAFEGAEAIREQRGRNELRVMVRLPAEQRASERDIAELEIRTPSGARVRLGDVATLERGRAPTAIKREDGRRIIDVSAELAPGVKSSREVVASLKEEVFPALLARHPGLEIGLVGSQREQREAFGSLGPDFLVAQFVIFALLAIPFRSYLQPLIVMSAVPFGFVGAVFGHLLMGYAMTIVSLMGIIALSGVVVNDSLVLIDAANAFRREGRPLAEAIRAAGLRRLRPILLTSLTTFFGLLPIIFERSVQARFLIPMALSLGFGVMFATLITLLLVPALYLLLEDARAMARRAWRWLAPPAEAG